MTKVLIIDDDEQINFLLRETFELEGYSVDTAKNGQEAQVLYTKNPYDVIITDIIMPEQDGFEVILDLRRLGMLDRVIAISGGGRMSADDYLVTADHFDVAASFAKPLDRKAILAKAKEIVETVGKK